MYEFAVSGPEETLGADRLAKQRLLTTRSTRPCATGHGAADEGAYIGR